MMLWLQAQGCHNINFVTPEHVVPQVVEAVSAAAALGLHLPIVYNTSAYDALESLALLEDIVDIFMPDLKYLVSRAEQDIHEGGGLSRRRPCRHRSDARSGGPARV